MLRNTSFKQVILFVMFAHLFSTVTPRTCDNLLDHRGLGIGVVLHVLPALASKLPVMANAAFLKDDKLKDDEGNGASWEAVPRPMAWLAG
jgi:hypothetical protein